MIQQVSGDQPAELPVAAGDYDHCSLRGCDPSADTGTPAQNTAVPSDPWWLGLARVGGEPLALAALRRARWRYGASRDYTRYRVAVVAEHSPGGQPTITDVLKVIEEGPDTLRAAARAYSEAGYQDRSADLVLTLDLLATGSLAGVFDQPTSRPIDLDALAVSVDISRVGAAGDKLLTAAMLCVWSYGFAMVDAAAALASQQIAPRRSYLAVMDELWRALRGAPGLVEYADSLTRLNRAKGMGSIMITHSLADLDALATEGDRAKARGFIERSAITVLGGLLPRELARVHEITPLTGPEQELVTSWSAPDSWLPGARHPGRGKYLIKTGERLGIPIELSLVGADDKHGVTAASINLAFRLLESESVKEALAGFSRCPGGHYFVMVLRGGCAAQRGRCHCISPRPSGG